MLLRSELLGLTLGERSLLTFVLVTLAVLVAGAWIRRTARLGSGGLDLTQPAGPARKGIRRRAGVILVAGPIVGFVIGGSFHGHAWIAVLGALGLAAAGVVADRRGGADRMLAAAIGVASLAAVLAGTRMGPTGVDVVDVLAAGAVIALVTASANGLGNSDGLGVGVGAVGALGVFALAAFAGQATLAATMAGLVAACVAFLAFNLPPASLFVGTAGRVTIGYVIAVGALSVRLPLGPTGRFLVPLGLLGIFLLDAAMVIGDRLVRRQSLVARRRDHIGQRLIARRWRPGEATTIVVAAQLVLSVVAVFTGRGVLALWAGAASTVLVLVVLGTEVRRGGHDERRPPGLTRRARIAVGCVVVGFLLASVPTILAATDVRADMEGGRLEAARALAAARNGDDIAAELGFRRAAGAFEQARDRLSSPTLEPGMLVPGLAPNLRAARALADIGRDLANAGIEVTAAVDQDAMAVVDGRLPLEELARVTPALDSGAAALRRAVRRLRALDDPYLLSTVRDSLREITTELTRASDEARRAAAAAHLGPAIFGAKGPRTYLLVVQNNAELRGTGGLIGNWGLMTAVDGKVSVGDLYEPSVFNRAVALDSAASTGISPEYDFLYPFRSNFAMQDANLSPDFPTVARVLTNLSRSAGLPPIDGVLAVDPIGLAALLELTGPVQVADWPVEISASNVVDVTLRDQYERLRGQAARTDFLGDVAKTVVDTATSGRLGSPARIAQILGAAAHEGHLTLAFARPREQHLAEQLDVAGQLAPIRSDALAVTTQNAAPSKIDYYLRRRVDYRVDLRPDADLRQARVKAVLRMRLENTAPDTGLPRIVIGPFDDNFVAGENRALVSVFSPLHVTQASVDGTDLALQGGPSWDRIAYSAYVEIPAKTTRTVEITLEGTVRLTDGWYQLDLGHQPTIEPDQLQVSVGVADGWKVGRTGGLARIIEQRAGTVGLLERPRRFRVRIVPAPAALDLWDRLEQGV